MNKSIEPHPDTHKTQETKTPARLADVIRNARDYLSAIQTDDGYWIGELEGDTILESEYAILLTFFGRTEDPKIRKLANYIRLKQNDEGGWSIYPGGPTNVSASVKAYWTLKLAGYSPDEPFMRRARERILELGGVAKTNTFTKIYLCVLGLYDWSGVPAIPPLMILFPPGFYLNIYDMSSWSRAILVPLSIVWAKKPKCNVPERAHIDELFVGGPLRSPAPLGWDRKVLTWRNFFLTVDLIIKWGTALHLTPLRDKAIKACEEWMLKRFEKTHGLAAIFPPMVNALMAMKALGFADDDERVQWMLSEIEKLEIEDGDTLRVQPCFSVVWDTAIAVNALSHAGVPPSDSSLQRAGRWLLSKEVRREGDWKVKAPEADTGGWYFEFENEFYPDVDDTAMVLMALSRIQLEKTHGSNGSNGNNGNHHNGDGNGNNNGNHHDAAIRFEHRKSNSLIYSDDARVDAMQRGLAWVLKMQNRDGGWSSFDKDNNRWILTQVPFADHNAIIDPSTADITGRVLEMLASFGLDLHDPAVRRAVEYLKRDQCEEGAWFGRWGVNYIYGTWQVLRGLYCVGEDMSSDYVLAAVNWLRRVQNEDGGWGESCWSYDDPSCKAQGASTVSQTAWALMGLFAAGDYNSPEVRQGIEYLLNQQNEDGTWSEEGWTGAGFPRVFYLKYHLYQVYFPLLALAMYESHHRELHESGFVVKRFEA